MSNPILKLLPLLLLSLLAARANITPDRLRCEYLTNPIGIDETQPRLDFILVTPDATPKDVSQSSYHILVASTPELLSANKGDLWDSGDVSSGETSQIVYAGLPLTSRERCYWKVQSKFTNGWTSEWSKPASFEMGLLKPEDWKASWIDSRNLPTATTLAGPLAIVSASYEAMDGAGAKDVTALVKGMVKDNKLSVKVSNDPMGGDPAPNHVKQLRIVYTTGKTKLSTFVTENATLEIPIPSQNVPYLRRDFPLAKSIAKARLYVTALGLYEVHINGKRVGDHIFTPDWTDYNKRVRYQAYDVTPLVKQGDNTLGAMLGNGWYAGHIGNGGYQAWGKVPALYAQLEVTYRDGKVKTISTDNHWLAHPGPILSSDFMLGETYDAQKEIAGWDKPGLNCSKWTPATERAEKLREIDDQVDQPVRQTGERPAKLMKEINGRYIYDLGQNMVGYVRLKVHEPAGTEIVIHHAEMLDPDGSIYTANLRGAPSIDRYTCKGGEAETWQPHFTFHGFRYVELSGLSKKPLPDAITGIVIGTDIPHTGTWACDNQPLNQLQSNIQWGMRGNYLSVPTDCPQRDERMGWMGDAQTFLRSATYNGDVAAFMTKWLVDVDDAQFPDGRYTDVSPPGGGAGNGNGGVPAWADAGVICPWTIYRVYGDKRILQKHLPGMKHWVDWCQAHSTNLIRDKDRSSDYGDWLSQGEDTSKEMIGTAFFAYSTSLVAKSCDALGDPDAAKYHQLADQVKAAFNQKYVKPDGHIDGDTQTAYCMAIRFDLLPDDLKAKAGQYLADNAGRHGDRLTTGFIGGSYLLPSLSMTGQVDEAYKLFEQDAFPSWLFSVKNGATTIWERWDGWRPDKGFQDPGMNSFNHYALGSCGEWMFDTVAGIGLDPKAPAFKNIIFHPTPGGTLKSAEATYDSINGKIAAKWTINGSTFHVHVSIPINARAELFLPGDNPTPVFKPGSQGQAFLTSGDYDFTCDLPSAK